MLERGFRSALRDLVDEEGYLERPEHVLVYECDGSTAFKRIPDAVVLPSTTGQVADVVSLCSRSNVAFVARGAGTGLSGGAIAEQGGVVIAMNRMNRRLDVDPDNRTARYQTGVVNLDISRQHTSQGLYFAPDPSSQSACTLGGNIAENSGGPHCLKYGATTAHILGLTVVLPTGEVVELEPGNGYDLVGLFVGSEGTYGIATEAVIRLMPLPQSVRTFLASFGDMISACEAVSGIIAKGIVPAALEMLDKATIAVVEAGAVAAGYPQDAAAVLLVELDGAEVAMDRSHTEVESVCRDAGALSFSVATDEQERARLWLGRKAAFGAMGRLSTDLYVQDGVVPRSRLPFVLNEVAEIAARHRIQVANVFHAGDGNLHPCIPYDGRDSDEKRRVLEAGREILELCVRQGGSVSGEHGIGTEKSSYMGLMFTEDDLGLMQELRAVFNPSGLCNPGKVFPTHHGCGEAISLPSVKAIPGAWI